MSKIVEISEAVLLATAWWKAFHNQRLTVKQIIMHAQEGDPELHQILEHLAPSDYKSQISPHKIGRWLVLAANTSIIIEGQTYRFINRGTDDTRRQLWQLSIVANEEEILPTVFEETSYEDERLP